MVCLDFPEEKIKISVSTLNITSNSKVSILNPLEKYCIYTVKPLPNLFQFLQGIVWMSVFIVKKLNGYVLSVCQHLVDLLVN